MAPSDDKFLCTLCKKDERLEKSWVYHISSIGHQRAVSRLPDRLGVWRQSQSAKERAVQIIGCQELHAAPIDIADFLTKNGGVVEEFICPVSISGTKPNIILCLFKTGESVTRLLELEEPKLFRQPLDIQRKFACREEKIEKDDYSEDWDKELEQDIEDPPPDIDSTNGITEAIVEALPDPTICDILGPEPININTKKRRKKKKQNLPALEDQLKELYQSHDTESRAKLVKDIAKVIKGTFSNCVLSSYGTDSFGVSLPEDEIRLCVDTYGKFGPKASGVISRNPSDPFSRGLIFQILSTHQQPDGSQLFNFDSSNSTAEPQDVENQEISFKSLCKGELLPCKLQFENFIVVQKSRLLKFLTNHDVRVWNLFSLVKHWSKNNQVLHEIREGEEFEGYILIMLMTFFLVKNNLLPSIITLRDLGKANPLKMDNLDISLCLDKKQVPPSKILGMNEGVRDLAVLSILKDFFEFISIFDFSENVICPSTGTFLERKSFRPKVEQKLPSELLKYYRFNADGSLRSKKLNTLSPVVIQDVFDLTDNIARAIDETELALLKSKSLETLKFLEDVFSEGKGNCDFRVLFSSKKEEDVEDEVSEYSDDEILVTQSSVLVAVPTAPIQPLDSGGGSPSMDDNSFAPSPSFSPSFNDESTKPLLKSPKIIIKSPDRTSEQEKNDRNNRSPPIKRRRTPSPQRYNSNKKWPSNESNPRKRESSNSSPNQYISKHASEIPVVRIARSPQRIAEQEKNSPSLSRDSGRGWKTRNRNDWTPTKNQVTNNSTPVKAQENRGTFNTDESKSPSSKPSSQKETNFSKNMEENKLINETEEENWDSSPETPIQTLANKLSFSAKKEAGLLRNPPPPQISNNRTENSPFGSNQEPQVESTSPKASQNHIGNGNGMLEPRNIESPKKGILKHAPKRDIFDSYLTNQSRNFGPLQSPPPPPFLNQTDINNIALQPLPTMQRPPFLYQFQNFSPAPPPLPSNPPPSSPSPPPPPPPPPPLPKPVQWQHTIYSPPPNWEVPEEIQFDAFDRGFSRSHQKNENAVEKPHLIMQGPKWVTKHELLQNGFLDETNDGYLPPRRNIDSLQSNNHHIPKWETKQELESEYFLDRRFSAHHEFDMSPARQIISSPMPDQRLLPPMPPFGRNNPRAIFNTPPPKQNNMHPYHKRFSSPSTPQYRRPSMESPHRPPPRPQHRGMLPTPPRMFSPRHGGFFPQQFQQAVQPRQNHSMLQSDNFSNPFEAPTQVYNPWRTNSFNSPTQFPRTNDNSNKQNQGEDFRILRDPYAD